MKRIEFNPNLIPVITGLTLNEFLKQAAEKALSDAGVPVNLAVQCAEIVAKDDPRKENLGRTQEEQHLINSSMQWIKVKEFFDK
jgi:hypothetical protein